MKMLAKIYRLLRTRIKENRQQGKQAQPSEQKQQLPTKPPTKRILIAYGIFSLLFIILASGAWFLKRAEWLPEYTLLDTNTSPIYKDNRFEYNDKDDATAKEYWDNPANTEQPVDHNVADKLDGDIKQLKDEIQQLHAELDVIRIRQYLATANYLIDMHLSPQRALSILQSARTYIEAHPDILQTNIAISLQDIDAQIVALQQYIEHSPKKALLLLAPLIADMETKPQAIPEPQTEQNINPNQRDESWTEKWLAKIYDVGKNLIRIEHTDNPLTKNNHLLLKLLITARTAVLLNEQEQFYIALNDAIRIIDTTPEPPIMREQIESILSLKIVWQLPRLQP